ncbi:uncharacterized protein IUM83_00628 [Phytophthora cinnamomi]|uniref:uncharacterized protein n=1 Tax=Phytophthora cinnamomi TaxID=4785 RepID=UPI00355A9C09|nr:hypothetical protein IUM83_00628 [Phytophthora cinnamomi]
MDLAKGLTTQQLHKVAEALRYIELTAGNTVYRCGEEAVAAYFVLSGRVRLFNGRERAKSSSLHVQRKTHCYTNDQL